MVSPVLTGCPPDIPPTTAGAEAATAGDVAPGAGGDVAPSLRWALKICATAAATAAASSMEESVLLAPGVGPTAPANSSVATSSILASRVGCWAAADAALSATRAALANAAAVGSCSLRIRRGVACASARISFAELPIAAGSRSDTARPAAPLDEGTLDALALIEDPEYMRSGALLGLDGGCGSCWWPCRVIQAGGGPRGHEDCGAGRCWGGSRGG